MLFVLDDRFTLVLAFFLAINTLWWSAFSQCIVDGKSFPPPPPQESQQAWNIGRPWPYWPNQLAWNIGQAMALFTYPVPPPLDSIACSYVAYVDTQCSKCSQWSNWGTTILHNYYVAVTPLYISRFLDLVMYIDSNLAYIEQPLPASLGMHWDYCIVREAHEYTLTLNCPFLCKSLYPPAPPTP